jgi:hypothetical protein
MWKQRYNELFFIQESDICVRLSTAIMRLEALSTLMGHQRSTVVHLLGMTRVIYEI